MISRPPLAPYSVRIGRAQNDLLWDESGRRYIDMFSAHGATWLGHANPAIARCLADQIERVWITGGLETAAAADARALVESFIPASHMLAGLYSTGMEAAEFALRFARTVTGRTGAVGFEKCMHGKSMATAHLGWDNKDGVAIPGFSRLPFVPECPEDQILARLETVLKGRSVSAVFVEPLQGSGGGHAASAAFYEGLARLCRRWDALLVFDEILTGFHRTGPPFFFSDLGFIPDIVLIGKALGNGFPVSGVVVSRAHPVRTQMLPGSTYAGNPLAACAVSATLRQMRSMDLGATVAAIEQVIVDVLGGVADIGATLRGRGALWVLALPPGVDEADAVVSIGRAGVLVGHTARQLRILPAATIERGHLADACAVIARELRRLHEEHGRRDRD